MNQFFVNHAAVFFILLIVFLICGITFVSYMVQKQQELRRRIHALSASKEKVPVPEPRDVRTPEEYAAALALMNDKLEALTARIQGSLQDQINQCLCKTKMVRYNAFDGLGGDLSFIWVLLDAENNGFILHNIYNREGNSNLYTRVIEKGVGLTHLAPEEEAVLADVVRRQPWEINVNNTLKAASDKKPEIRNPYIQSYSAEDHSDYSDKPADRQADDAQAEYAQADYAQADYAYDSQAEKPVDEEDGEEQGRAGL